MLTTSASVGLLRQQWFPRRSKSKVVGAPQVTRRRLAGESQKAGRWITGFS